ncbi:MAG: hypothetical protein CL532_04975 [Aestuariivita sp.]|nr:hypothetical protein [Aestuariivita sp.]
MSIELIIFLIIIVSVVLYAISLYNKIVTIKNRVDNGWAQIDVQLQRRYDLIPNLVETAKSYMKHEQETLELVINARNSANEISKKIAEDPTNKEFVEKLQEKEKLLQTAMMSFQALAEAYPDLKANTNMLALQEELSTTENKVSFSRQAFNDAVMVYNTGIEMFPNSIIANYFNFTEASEWVIEDQGARDNVKVSFD